MDLAIDNYRICKKTPAFKSVLDGAFTNTMRVLQTNEMVNAVALDVGPMSIPRAWYDGTHRNIDAGIETLGREFSGTFINCLSAGVFASAISYFASKFVNPRVEINPDSWYSKDSLETLQQAWKEGGENVKGYVAVVFDNLSGIDGHKINEFKNIRWDEVEWIDRDKWDKIKWQNPEYKNIQDSMKSRSGFINTMVKIISDKNIAKEDRINIMRIMNLRLTNALGTEMDTRLNIGDRRVYDKLANIVRDTYNMGKDIFTNKDVESLKAISKIARINKMKIAGALSASCLLGLTNQYINRKITEKRTGKKGFVGEVDYTSKDRKEMPKDKTLLAKKIIASAGMIAMVLSVMRVKNWKDFVKKLEFTGPVTSGNAIKTVYATNIVGRFMAADSSTEVRESCTRDYLGFLNWLVFGGFTAKGVGNLLDFKGTSLFNYKKEGKGLKHWLNDLELKTHNELAAKGKVFAMKNIWKLNIAHACGITYSAITLGLLLPMLNDKITRYKYENRNKKIQISIESSYCKEHMV